MSAHKGPEIGRKPQTGKQSVKRRLLGRHAIIQIVIGTFMIFAYPRLPGFIMGGLLLTLGFVLGALYLRERSNK